MNLHRLNVILLALGLLALLAGMWAGLVRIGWDWPALIPEFFAAHGPLMVGGFLGTLIGLERAVALGRPWAYIGPAAAGLSVPALLVGAPWPVVPILLLLGSIGIGVDFFALVVIYPSWSGWTMGLGALCWVVGNVVWLAERSVPAAVFWWIGFLVLTIAGERLELNRSSGLTGWSRLLFGLAAGVLLVGLLFCLPGGNLVLGMRVSGVGLSAMAVWLLVYDMARSTVRQRGLTRFVAASLLLGFVWLGTSGILAFAYAGQLFGFGYDAILHSLFLGFAVTMIFAHAPVIFPGITGQAVPFRPSFYSYLILLHLALILRIGSDVAQWHTGQMWGGLGNATALLLFVVSIVMAVRAGRAGGRSSEVATPG